MKQSIFLIIICSMVLSCNSRKPLDKNDTITKPDSVISKNTKLNTETDAYFTASGTEPFWQLKITTDRVILTTPDQTITTPHTEPIKAADANIKSYRIRTESTHLNIQIQQAVCYNSSGEQSTYTVTIELKKGTDKDFTTLNGCGNYITDYRLYDIWVLEELNGKTIAKEDFNREFPRMEINATTNRFMGFTGCNQMNGSLFFEKDILRFTKIVTTEMMCEPGNKEAEFLKALQSTTAYTIAHNHLELSNPNGTILIFKKID